MAGTKQFDHVLEETLKVQEDIDRTFYRKFKVNMYRCVANCYKDEAASHDQIERCVEKCSIPLVKTMEAVDAEIDDIQKRFLTCGTDCEQIRGDGKSKYNDCISNCSIDYHRQIPDAMQKIKKKIGTGPKDLFQVI